MSHISTIKMEIADLATLAEAAQALGLELRENQKTFKTFNRQTTKCDAAIVAPENPDCYEIGVTRTAAGTYELQHDDFAGGMGMVAKAGKQCRRLLVEYGVARTKSLARQKGWRYHEQREENGQVHCYVTPPTSWTTPQQASGKRW